MRVNPNMLRWFSRLPVGLSIVLGGLIFTATLRAQTAPTPTPTPTPAPAAAGGADQGVRLKDLARITGVRVNQLLGYGLVVGLPGTGDSRSQLASDSIRNLLGGMGAETESGNLNARNVAAVLVTAEIPPFARPGDRVNVTVSSIGDARSLESGVLVQTPLQAGNRTIYAVAQGVITTGGRTEEGPQSRNRNDTVGVVLNGAVIEREVSAGLVEQGAEQQPPVRRIRVSLNNFDFTTLNKVRERLAAELADAQVGVDGGSVVVTLPDGVDPVAYIARMEQIRIQPDYRARVVINERTGVVVMGGDVRIDPVSISRGGMELILTGKAQDARMGIHVAGGPGAPEEKPVTQEFSGASVAEIVKALNALGANVRDVIAILEALRDSGALHAELTVI